MIFVTNNNNSRKLAQFILMTVATLFISVQSLADCIKNSDYNRLVKELSWEDQESCLEYQSGKKYCDEQFPNENRIAVTKQCLLSDPNKSTLCVRSEVTQNELFSDLGCEVFHTRSDSYCSKTLGLENHVAILKTDRCQLTTQAGFLDPLKLLNLLDPTQSLAQESCNPTQDAIKLLIQNPRHSKVEEFSTSGNDVKRAKCRTQTAFTESELAGQLISIQVTDQEETIEFNGIQLENSSQKLNNALKKLTTYHPDYFETYQPKKNPWTQPTYSLEATTAILASQEIWGQTKGLRMLLLSQKYGVNTSAAMYRDSREWTERELETIEKTLRDLPSHLKNRFHDKRFIHNETGNQRPGVYADASFTIYDLWDGLDEASQQSVLMHEFGHHMAHQLDQIHTSPEWLKLSSWKGEKMASVNPALFNERNIFDKNWHVGKCEHMVSEYAETNPSEDFAETFTAYRYNPKKLLRISPEKYQFMKEKVFNGVEYLLESQCRGT